MSLQFDVAGWRQFLNEWNAEMLRIAAQMPGLFEHGLGREALERGSILREGAPDDALSDADRRIGKLPQSLRRFYLASNGLTVAGLDAETGEVWPVEKIRLLREGDPGLIHDWVGGSHRHATDEEYFVYGPEQHTMALRTAYFETNVQLTPYVDASLWMLNPLVIDERGEWEAWRFGARLPGAVRYRSFEEMLIAERRRIVGSMRRHLELRGAG